MQRESWYKGETRWYCTRDVTTRRRPEQRSFKELENVEKLLKGKG